MPLPSVQETVTIKSTPAHDAVAAALSHRHHLIIHVGVGPIQLANGSHSLLVTDTIHHRFLFSPIFWRRFSKLTDVLHTGTRFIDGALCEATAANSIPSQQLPHIFSLYTPWPSTPLTPSYMMVSVHSSRATTRSHLFVVFDRYKSIHQIQKICLKFDVVYARK